MSDGDLRQRLARMQRLREAMPRRLARFERPSGEGPRPAPPPAGEGEPRELRGLPPGEELHTPLGVSYLFTARFAFSHEHGDAPLGTLAGRSLASAARFAAEPRLASLTAADCAFIDTETTGLSLGAGTLVFLVAVGLITDEGFEVRQFFLRSPDEEPAMLAALDEALAGRPALVTFNGRSFDVPMLAGRYLLNRMRSRLEALPNLDLLPPARRLWRRRLASCALGNLEREVLGVYRSAQDVPGWMIPTIYTDYLRTGDTSGIARVVYHNLMDVLSMVTLAARLCRDFEMEAVAERPMPPQDQLSLARWYAALNMPAEAEAAYRAAVDADLSDEDLRQAFRELTTMLRRAGRRAEAAEQWALWSARIPSDPEPCVEIAKHLEWHTRDLPGAHRWATAALEAVERWPAGRAQAAARAEIRHRLARLERKMGRVS